MIVAVVLGNRLNDDGSITDKMRCRLDLASEIHKTLLPCKMVLSGGVANPLAGKSEAQAMFDILVREGVPQNVLIREEKSLTTKQNAFYSVPIVAQCGADVLLLCPHAERIPRHSSGNVLYVGRGAKIERKNLICVFFNSFALCPKLTFAVECLSSVSQITNGLFSLLPLHLCGTLPLREKYCLLT